jgi:hypothetical protein
MHVPNPLGLARPAQRTWSYFRSGVRVEGEAFLTDEPAFLIWFEGMPERRVPQHVYISLRFWASRSEPVTVIDIARAEIPLYRVELADFGTFDSVTLNPGQKPVESYFRLYPVRIETHA